MKKFFAKLKSVIPSKRKLIQLYAALLFNANIKGFVTGSIYKGASKNICAPGINCYSCPGAIGACPLGSLQNALGASSHRAPFYVIGILMLYGLLLGRFICGFLCPFGLIQELLYKIKTPKLKKNRFTRILSYLKYVILVFFVFIVPILYAVRNLPVPAFCKYICPAGTLEGAFGYLSHKVNESELAALGPLFTWKFLLFVSILVGSVFIFRLFCRFLCPLGAIYGLFNHFSVFGIKLDKSKCTSCGLCISKCKMDIRHVNDQECISCGECRDVCPTKAITWKGSKIILPENDFEAVPVVTADSTAAEKQEAERIIASNEAKKQRNQKRARIFKIAASVVLTLILGFALIYYNFIDKKPTPSTDNTVTYGNKVGDLCVGYEMDVFDENGATGERLDPTKNTGKITIINFWGTWCGGCIQELPFFDRIATEYKDTVTVVAVHTERDYSTAPGYVLENYKDSDMVFTRDDSFDSDDKYSDGKYFKMLGGGDSYPITVILDANGVIIASVKDSMTYSQLKEIVDNQLSK